MGYLFKADLLKEINARFIEFVTGLYEKSAYHVSNPNHKTYEIHFVAGGLFLMLLHWIERGMPESPEEMAQMTVRMLRIPSSEMNRQS